MKLVEVEYLFEGGKAVFYFTAEGRVDFRQLVKELAHECRIRIEMRQIGVRDEARMIGGYGICGRELCCASFLSEFEPISIRMAKDQDLPLSPGKVSGVCGRLMCCLGYEARVYEEFKRGLPKLGERVRVREGVGPGAQAQPLRGRLHRRDRGRRAGAGLEAGLAPRLPAGGGSRRARRPRRRRPPRRAGAARAAGRSSVPAAGSARSTAAAARAAGAAGGGGRGPDRGGGAGRRSDGRTGREPGRGAGKRAAAGAPTLTRRALNA